MAVVVASLPPLAPPPQPPPPAVPLPLPPEVNEEEEEEEEGVGDNTGAADGCEGVWESVWEWVWVWEGDNNDDGVVSLAGLVGLWLVRLSSGGRVGVWVSFHVSPTPRSLVSMVPLRGGA